MAKYRKKPVVVEAFQYDGDLIYSNGEWYCPDWARDAFQNGTMYFDSLDCEEPPVELFIDALEGKHHVSVGDFISVAFMVNFIRANRIFSQRHMNL